jgi:hypothetical protein
MVLISPSNAILAVFVLSTWTLCVSLWRDLSSVDPWELESWRSHAESYLRNSTHPEELMKDVSRVADVFLDSELTVFMVLQWLFSAYAAAAVLVMVRDGEGREACCGYAKSHACTCMARDLVCMHANGAAPLHPTEAFPGPA